MLLLHKMGYLSIFCSLQNEAQNFDMNDTDGESTVFKFLENSRHKMENTLIQSNNISIFNLFLLVSSVKMHLFYLLS